VFPETLEITLKALVRELDFLKRLLTPMAPEVDPRTENLDKLFLIYADI
jgi:hypothetical protein